MPSRSRQLNRVPFPRRLLLAAVTALVLNKGTRLCDLLRKVGGCCA